MTISAARTRDRILDAASRVVGLIPWFAGLSLALAAAYVRLEFGGWPRVYIDSVDAPLSNLAAQVAVISTFSLLFIVVLTLLLLLARRILGIRPVLNAWVASAIVGCVVVYLISFWDPFGFVAWAID